jgi:hypothetical protein
MRDDPALNAVVAAVKARNTFLSQPHLQPLWKLCEQRCGEVRSEALADLTVMLAADAGIDRHVVESLAVDGLLALVNTAWPNSHKECATVLQSTNEERDAWLCCQKLEGKTHTAIRIALERDHPEWDRLDSDQAVGRAIDRYCTRTKRPRIRRKAN